MAILKADGTLSGKVGNVVFRRFRNGKVVVASAPKKKNKKKPVVKRVIYAAKPLISSITATRNKMGVRDLVIIDAEKSNLIESMEIEILDSKGKLIETGEAFQPDDHQFWYYHTVNLNKVIFGAKIIVTATTKLGNKISKEIILD